MVNEGTESIKNEVESVVNEAPREQKLLAMRIPCGDAMDW